FWDKDMWATFTYDNENLPTSEKQAQSNIKNYIRRLKAYIKKHGLPNLKYIYVTEYIEDSNKGGRVHHHIVMNFKDRDIAEKMWNKGNRKQTRRLQPDENGLEGLARYILKEGKDTETRKHSKSYFTSKGLEKPKETKSDYKITKRKVSNIAKDENGAKAIFETMNKGYKFNDLNVKYSEYVSGIYMYARMKKAPVKNNKKKRRN
ncbi:MAG: hypothetical protein FWF50_03070, partial [Defluviitaleaceae bacterium]|nr:hypothetical protein [Defluviitaleaceae bacterium]